MNLSEIQKRMSNLKDWALDGNAITKEYNFVNFKEAMQFVNKVSEIAERNSHHPDIIISYNIVRLTLITHSLKQLTEKDFDIAQEIDKP